MGKTGGAGTGAAIARRKKSFLKPASLAGREITNFTNHTK